MTAPITSAPAQNAALTLPARHRAINCESCDGQGYLGGPPFGRDQEVCKGCDGAGGKVVRCDGETVSLFAGHSLPAGPLIPTDYRKLAEGLRGAAHDANGNGHTDDRNELLLAADAVEHLFGALVRAHEAEVAKLRDALARANKDACGEIERSARLARDLELHAVALRAEQRMREQDEITRRELVDGHNAELAALHEHVARLEEDCAELRSGAPVAVVAEVDAAAGAAS